MFKNPALAPVLVCTFLLAGCGDSQPDVAPVSGTVEYNGQPVAGASVTFVPKEGKPANGVTDADGGFTLTTFASGDGAIIGEHTVTVVAMNLPSEDDPLDSEGSMALDDLNEPIPDDPSYQTVESTPIPTKYAQTSTTDLKVTVTDGENAPKLVLTD